MTIRVLILCTVISASTATLAAQSNIDPNNKFAWCENIGWTNWRDANGGADGVVVGATFLSGFIWGKNVGWINVGSGAPANGVHYANTTTVSDSSLTITNSIVNDFKQYLKDNSYHYEDPLEKKLNELEELAEQQEYDNKFLDYINSLRESVKQMDSTLFDKARENIKKILKQEIASKCFGTHYSIRIGIGDDPVVQQALQLVSEQNLYNGLLGIDN